jgi:hypothetical protein
MKAAVRAIYSLSTDFIKDIFTNRDKKVYLL